MSNDDMSTQQQIRLLTLAEPHDCSYLPNLKANSIFLDSQQPPSWKQYSELSRMGFRRSGSHYYRPNCPSCNACMSSRIIANELNFKSKSFKRLIQKAGNLVAALEKPIFSSSHYDIYEKYIQIRHKDGDMYPPSIEQYRSFLLQQTEISFLFTLRTESGQLVSCTVIDVLDDGLSAIYTYFDPDFSHLSPGTLAILMLTQYAIERELPYVYLGYWIKNSQKMSYKQRFKPLEVFNGEFWQPLTDEG